MALQQTLFSHPAGDQPQIVAQRTAATTWAHDALFHEPEGLSADHEYAN
ncbi:MULTISPECIES: hypothetical protein [unclassified Crossiella]|nr:MULTISPECIES: hypothetical protein [unclassified Crossiella]MCO1578572.1 hypothetical protein [Crossiella sp. SN42]WHT22236.1 hypothetical protein N8J89_14545 [Crossiella sp. CA-258035]